MITLFGLLTISPRLDEFLQCLLSRVKDFAILPSLMLFRIAEVIAGKSISVVLSALDGPASKWSVYFIILPIQAGEMS